MQQVFPPLESTELEDMTYATPSREGEHTVLGNDTTYKTDNKAQLTAVRSVTSMQNRNDTDCSITARARIVTGYSIFLEYSECNDLRNECLYLA